MLVSTHSCASHMTFNKFQTLIAIQSTITAGRSLSITTSATSIFLELLETWLNRLPATVKIPFGVVDFVAIPNLLSWYPRGPKL